MTWPAVDTLKQQIPLLDYLQSQNWKPVRRISHGRLMGLCPLHDDHQSSFLVDPAKNLFYCYGCGRGGDLIRFVELYFAVGFRDAMTLLRSPDRESLLKDVVSFYQIQLHRHPEAAHYLQLRGIQQPQIVEELAIGYAPGRCLRPWLMTLGYSLSYLQQVGLVNAAGYDTFSQRLVFSFGVELIWAQHCERRGASFSAGRQRWTLWLGASETITGSHCGGGTL